MCWCLAVAPVIKQKPKVVRREKQIIIECHVESSSKPECIWNKESTVIREDSRHKTIIRESQTKGSYEVLLEINEPTVKDKGIYHLVAKNEKGEVTSQAIQVSVDEEEEEELLKVKKKKGTKPKFIQTLKSEVTLTI